MERTPFERLVDLLCGGDPLDDVLSDLGIGLKEGRGGLVFELQDEDAGVLLPLDGDEVGVLLPRRSPGAALAPLAALGREIRSFLVQDLRTVVDAAADRTTGDQEEAAALRRLRVWLEGVGRDVSGWREIDPGDLVLAGDRIRNPYGEEQKILDVHDGSRVSFGDGDTWTVGAMAVARDWSILKAGTSTTSALETGGTNEVQTRLGEAADAARGRRQALEDGLKMISSGMERIAEVVDDEGAAEKTAVRMLERSSAEAVSGDDVEAGGAPAHPSTWSWKQEPPRSVLRDGGGNEVADVEECPGVGWGWLAWGRDDEGCTRGLEPTEERARGIANVVARAAYYESPEVVSLLGLGELAGAANAARWAQAAAEDAARQVPPADGPDEATRARWGADEADFALQAAAHAHRQKFPG